MEKTTNNWLCYLIKSVDSNRTYIGATNNLLRRLNDHCGINGKSKGAKATRGEMWYVVLYIDGFDTKIECLSFEYQFKILQYFKSSHEKHTQHIECLFKLTHFINLHRAAYYTVLYI